MRMKSITLAILVSTISLFLASNAFAVDFVDRTGYIPEWAIEMGQQQALMACSGVEYGTPDSDWCNEYSGYVLDQMNKQLDEQQNPDEVYPTFDESTKKPQFDTNLFSNVKQVSTNTYVNKFYKFSIEPPTNWQISENAELLGGESAAIVAFYSDDPHPTYTSNFIITYQNVGSDLVELLRYSSDDQVLDEFATGFTLGTAGLKILEKEIKSYNDGYKIKLQFVQTPKLEESQFATLQQESIVYLLDNGDRYMLSFASTPEDFNTNIGAFRKSAESFHVGEIQYVQSKPDPEPKVSESSSKCGTGTVEKDGICVPAQKEKTNDSQNSGCLIATAAFDSELTPQVQLLREVRDNVLFSTGVGTTFMAGFNEFYYSFSPTVADWERQSPLFKEVVKSAITPMLSTMSILNYANIDSEQEMLGYGIGVILLNIGMYFVAPTIIIVKLRQKFKNL